MNKFEYFQYERILKRLNCVVPHHKGYKCVPLRSDTECQKCVEKESKEKRGET